jgi:hypothetical protein
MCVRHDLEPGDTSSLAIVLSAGKNRERVEAIEQHESGIHVAMCLTVLAHARWSSRRSLALYRPQGNDPWHTAAGPPQ